MSYLDRLHPVCALTYFAAVLLVAMLTMHPVIVMLCLVSGMTLYGMLCGGKRLVGSLRLSLPLMLVMAVLNPLFSHKGSTVLLFINDRPVTLEATVYGAVSALMIAAVFYWFMCMSRIMTSDKVMALFGRVSPKLSLLLSMTLSAIPRIKRQYREINEACDEPQGAAERLRQGGRCLFAVTSRMLEGSIDTADSMRARGYGLRGRTSYSMYRFSRVDLGAMTVILTLGGATVTLVLIGGAEFSYYPRLSSLSCEPTAPTLYILTALLTGSSILMEVKEWITWHILRSTI